jgi:hypothetical protein
MRLDVFVKKLLSEANESSYDGKFSGFPLRIIMDVTSFELDLETISKSDNYIAPENMDILYVCHRFLEKKLQVYHTEKGADDTNASFQNYNELLINMFLKNLERSALIVTWSPPVLTLLHYKTTDNKSRLA